MSRLSQIFSSAVENGSDSSESSLDKQQKRRSISKTLISLFSSSRNKSPYALPSVKPPSSNASKSPEKGSEAIIVYPPVARTTSSRFSISLKAKTPRDSTLSSVSSFNSTGSSKTVTPSISSSRTAIVKLIPTKPEILKLQSLLRRAGRQFKKQEFLTNTLSINLSTSLSRKQNHSSHNHRLPSVWRDYIHKLIQELRVFTVRMFMRKVLLSQRSSIILHKLIEQFKDLEEGKEVILDVEGVLDNLASLKGDLEMQRRFDNQLRDKIAKPCLRAMFPQSKTERATLINFVGFVDARLETLNECYGVTWERIDEFERVLEGVKTL
ncbi:hypothetical protein B0O99DRAFT_597263 [Bisporella sp. PMI_857]|nr:hypothetical protein B0O99DRAFT_597263 [Bisporella sp. PMI_857]